MQICIKYTYKYIKKADYAFIFTMCECDVYFDLYIWL